VAVVVGEQQLSAVSELLLRKELWPGRTSTVDRSATASLSWLELFLEINLIKVGDLRSVLLSRLHVSDWHTAINLCPVPKGLLNCRRP